MAPSYGATGWYRCNVPGKELARQGHTVHLDVVPELNYVYEYDIMVISNGAAAPAVQAVDYAKSIGKFVIADLDDDPWHMTEWNPGVATWSGEQQYYVETVLAHADRVTTTNSSLAEYLTRFNKDVVVLPNCLPGEYWKSQSAPRDTAVLGWIGGHTHYGDLEMVAEPVNRVLAERDDVELCLTIFEEPPFEPTKKVTVLEHTSDLTALERLYGSIGIGIAPLVDDHFNRSKSDLKFLEYGAAGVPCVASDIVTYNNTIRHGENGFLARTSQDWFDMLTQLIDDADLRRRVGAEARKTAESRFIDKNIGLWEKAYNLAPS